MGVRMRAFRGMVVRCSNGSIDNFINTDYGHGVLFNGYPVLNANDIIRQINLVGFGDCRSSEYIHKKMTEKIENSGNEIVLNDVIKCVPEVTKPWIQCNEINIIDGAPCLLVGSCCSCLNGGKIEVMDLTDGA